MVLFSRLASLAVTIALVIATSAYAEPVTVSGVKYDDTVMVGGSKLKLNGAGIRYKAFVKVYTAGLYLTESATTPKEIMERSGAKRMHVVMLRDIDSAELGKLFTRSVEENMSRTKFSKLVPGLIQLGEIFATQKRLMAGDSFSFDWIPGTGAVLSVKGVALGEPFNERQFFNAMMKVWLGKSPADWKLKDALLKKSNTTPTGY
jgi:Chalcone isomerase-like